MNMKQEINYRNAMEESLVMVEDGLDIYVKAFWDWDYSENYDETYSLDVSIRAIISGPLDEDGVIKEDRTNVTDRLSTQRISFIEKQCRAELEQRSIL